MDPRRTPSTPRLSARARSAVERARRAIGDPRAGFDLAWVRALTDAPIETIDRTVGELEEIVPIAEEILRRHREAGRPHYAQIRAPFELYVITRLLRPDHIIETGVSSGVSSTHFLLALRKNRRGTLHSIDRPTFQRGRRFRSGESPVTLPPGEASGWAMPRTLRSAQWDLRLGSSEALLPSLVEEIPSLGIFLHDSLHTPAHLTFELETVRPKLVPGGVALADNTSWTGTAFPRFARRLGVRPKARGRSDLVGLRVPPSL